MPAPKDLAKMRAGQIREDAADELYKRLRDEVEKLVRIGKIQLNNRGEPNQKQAARLLGIPQPMMNRMLGKKQMPGADYLAVLCVTLGVSSDEMLGLPASDVERARRLAYDYLDPIFRRRLYEMLKEEFDGAPKELEAADLEVAPQLPTSELPPETGREAEDSGGHPATKRSGKRRRTKR